MRQQLGRGDTSITERCNDMACPPPRRITHDSYSVRKSFERCLRPCKLSRSATNCRHQPIHRPLHTAISILDGQCDLLIVDTGPNDPGWGVDGDPLLTRGFDEPIRRADFSPDQDLHLGAPRPQPPSLIHRHIRTTDDHGSSRRAICTRRQPASNQPLASQRKAFNDRHHWLGAKGQDEPLGIDELTLLHLEPEEAIVNGHPRSPQLSDARFPTTQVCFEVLGHDLSLHAVVEKREVPDLVGDSNGPPRPPCGIEDERLSPQPCCLDCRSNACRPRPDDCQLPALQCSSPTWSIKVLVVHTRATA